MRSTAWAKLLVMLALVGCDDRREPASPRSTATATATATPSDLDGHALDPLALDGRPDLLVFLRTDCPISNRYAPELGRIGARFGDRVDLWLIYVDRDETPAKIRQHLADYQLPGTPLRDPNQTLVARAGVEVTPEAALFDGQGQRRYHGRIDDRYLDYGKARAAPTTHELVDALAALLAETPVAMPAPDHAAAIGCPLPPLPGAAT